MTLEIGGTEIERIGEDCKTKYFKFVGMLVDERNPIIIEIRMVDGGVTGKFSFGNFGSYRQAT